MFYSYKDVSYKVYLIMIYYNVNKSVYIWQVDQGLNNCKYYSDSLVVHRKYTQVYI